MTSENNLISVSDDQLDAFIRAAMISAGMPASDAQAVAALITQADLQGSDGHGVIRLPQYLGRIRAGGINLKPDIRVVREQGATALVDGDNGMGHLVMSFATQLAIRKARGNGVAWVGVKSSNHAGPASLYAQMPLAHDMIGLYFAVGSANHLPAWGGVDLLLSTNPISVAIPAGKEPPVVLDMATTVTAYGKVKAKAKRGESMPEGWMIDRQGRPLTDPRRADEGLLLPIGGHKGYGLALIIGLLAGTLNGAAMGKDVVDFNKDHVTQTNTGQAIMVLDPRAFGDPVVFASAVDVLVRDIRASKKLPGIQRVWLPGEQSDMRRSSYSRDGIPFPSALLAELDAMADALGIPHLVVRQAEVNHKTVRAG